MGGTNGSLLQKKHRLLSKEAASEGMVLLKNNENTLPPLTKNTKVALFGKASIDYVKGGGGSGDVTVEYATNLYEGMKQLAGQVEVFEPPLSEFYQRHVHKEYSIGKEPGLTEEPTVSKGLFDEACAYTDTAVVSICRFSGEGWDRKSSSKQTEVYAEPWVEKYALMSDSLFENGDFALSEREMTMITEVKNKFDKVIVIMNVGGGVVDTSWFINDDAIDAVLMAWQGGMEGGAELWLR